MARRPRNWKNVERRMPHTPNAIRIICNYDLRVAYVCKCAGINKSAFYLVFGPTLIFSAFLLVNCICLLLKQCCSSVQSGTLFRPSKLSNAQIIFFFSSKKKQRFVHFSSLFGCVNDPCWCTRIKSSLSHSHVQHMHMNTRVIYDERSGEKSSRCWCIQVAANGSLSNSFKLR